MVEELRDVFRAAFGYSAGERAAAVGAKGGRGVKGGRGAQGSHDGEEARNGDGDIHVSDSLEGLGRNSRV